MPMFSGLMIRMEKTYWSIIMAELNKIQDDNRQNVLCFCIEDIHAWLENTPSCI